MSLNIRKTTKPVSSLIIFGILKGYIKNPLGFLIKSKITFKKFKKTIELDLPNDFIDSSGLIAWLYIRLLKQMDKQKAFEIVRACVLTTGFAVQQASFCKIDKERNLQNLIKYQQITNNEGTTKLNTMEIIEQSEKRYEFRVTRCLFLEFFTHVGVPELTSIMCSIDNAIFNSYLPEKLTFHRNGLNRTKYEGHKYCEFVIENNE